jgi:hypothetical protein
MKPLTIEIIIHTVKMKFALLCFVVLPEILLQGCGGISNADQIVLPSKNVSYSQQVEPVLTLACNTPGCHDRSAAGDVDLSSWTSIRDGLNGGLVIVDKSNSYLDTSSILILTLFAEEHHTTPLSVNENQRDGIKTWIMQGALLN